MLNNVVVFSFKVMYLKCLHNLMDVFFVALIGCEGGLDELMTDMLGYQ